MKMCVLFCAVIIALTLCSCTQQHELPPPVDEQTSQTTAEITNQITLPNPLPWPESIVLIEDISYELSYGELEYTHRVIYYDVPNQIFMIVDDDGFSLLIDGEDLHSFDEAPEMALVSFIKHYKIKKDDFVAAVLREYEWAVERGWNIYDESNELPNADIIYTFDNEIINAYYRRENPVVPEPGTYKTYESYAEYLRANR